MKSSDSTEMERLLRRYARRRGEALHAVDDKQSESQTANNTGHLDADELNAYAEGAVPDSARSRYFAHLADCDSCRKLVTDLTLSATRAVEERARVAAVSALPSKTWRDWLAAIFSPPALRYGVPALALLAVIIVAIVATRTSRQDSYVAQKEDAATRYSPSIVANSNTSATTTVTSDGNHRAGNVATPSIEPVRNKETDAPAGPAPDQSVFGKDNAAPPTLADEARPAPTPAPSIQEGRQMGEVAKSADVPAAAAQKPAPAESVSSTDVASRDKSEQQKKKQAGKDDDAVGTSSRAAGGVTSTESEMNESRPATGRRTTRPTQTAPANRPAAPPKSESVELAAERERSADTRSVGGRKFRRQDNAWVDTAYKSSLPLTNVTRGSEQYRALIADEPGLRSITQQLGGEVIVVWKSRGYRFH